MVSVKCIKCENGVTCHKIGYCKLKRLGGDGSEPTTCSRSAERVESKAKVKSGEREPNGARTTARVHGRRVEKRASFASEMIVEDSGKSSHLGESLREVPSFLTGERSDLNDEPPRNKIVSCPHCVRGIERLIPVCGFVKEIYCKVCKGSGKIKSNTRQPETKAERSGNRELTE